MQEYKFNDLCNESKKVAIEWFRANRSADIYHERTLQTYRSYYALLGALNPYVSLPEQCRVRHYDIKESIYYHRGRRLMAWLNYHLFDVFYKPKWYYKRKYYTDKLKCVERYSSCQKKPWAALTGYTSDYSFEKPFLDVMRGRDTESSLYDLMQKVDDVLMRNITAALDSAYGEQSIVEMLTDDEEDEGQEYFYFDKDGNHTGWS